MTGGAGTVAGVLSPDRKVTGSNPAFCHFLLVYLSIRNCSVSVDSWTFYKMKIKEGALVELPGAQ